MKKKNLQGAFRMRFPFEHTKKKIPKTNFDANYCHSTLLMPKFGNSDQNCDYFALWRICFFSYVQKESSYEKHPEDSFFSPTFFLF